MWKRFSFAENFLSRKLIFQAARRRSLAGLCLELATLNYFKLQSKIKNLDDKIVVKYNKVTEKLKTMSDHEILLRDLLISEQVKNEMSLSQKKYINIQSQHFNFNLIEYSTIHEDLDLIARSLFHRNSCTVKTCETEIFRQKGLKKRKLPFIARSLNCNRTRTSWLGGS